MSYSPRPSQCRMPEYKGGKPKKRYATWEEAWAQKVAVLAERPLMEVYFCEECSHYHLGQRRLTDEEWAAEQDRRARLRTWRGPSPS